MKTNKLLVLGIGNTLLCDEGAGIHALQLLQAQTPNIPGAVYVDGGTLSFTLATYFEDCSHLIVFDAAEINASPGSVETFVGDDMDNFLGVAKRSPHEVGLLDLFDMARLTGTLPEQRALIGIQPADMDWSTRPSAVVEQALPRAVAAATGLLRRWEILEAEAFDAIHTPTDSAVTGSVADEVSTRPMR
ncbi:MAG: HyaD/HybD family hydrogenase maturation endopeptidase [Gammaproteobacteria bacterium]